MPLYMIERTFAEQLDLTGDDVQLIEEINADEGVRWLFSFLSADRRRTYCLYEAPSPEAIVAAGAAGNVPADAIVEVGSGTPGSPAAWRTRRRAPARPDPWGSPVTSHPRGRCSADQPEQRCATQVAVDAPTAAFRRGSAAAPPLGMEACISRKRVPNMTRSGPPSRPLRRAFRRPRTKNAISPNTSPGQRGDRLAALLDTDSARSEHEERGRRTRLLGQPAAAH